MFVDDQWAGADAAAVQVHRLLWAFVWHAAPYRVGSPDPWLRVSLQVSAWALGLGKSWVPGMGGTDISANKQQALDWAQHFQPKRDKLVSCGVLWVWRSAGEVRAHMGSRRPKRLLGGSPVMISASKTPKLRQACEALRAPI